MNGRGQWIGFALLGAAYLALAASLPAVEDEFYYWCWAQDLQASYFDHPPLIAYLIRASGEAFGQSLWAVRLPACLASLVVLGVIARLTRPRTLLPLVVLTPLFTFGAVIVSPDVPLLLFWALYLAWQVRLHERLQNGQAVTIGLWALGGLLLGCGMLGKYTAALAVPTGLLALLLARRPWRAWLPGYALHGLVALAVFSPVLAFNINRSFEPFLFQWHHAVQSEQPGGLQTFGEFLGIQLLLFGLLPVGLLPWVVARRRELLADPRLRVCACAYAAPMAFFLIQAVRGPLEGNWALVCYVGVWPIAARWHESISSPSRRALSTALAFALPLVGVLTIAIHLIVPLPIIPPEADRITRQSAKTEMARAVAADLKSKAIREPLYVPTYQWTALLRYHGVDARQIDGFSRPSQFTAQPARLTDHDPAYLFAEGAFPPELVPGYGPPCILHAYPLVVRGTTITTYYLIRYDRITVPGTERTAPLPHDFLDLNGCGPQDDG